MPDEEFPRRRIADRDRRRWNDSRLDDLKEALEDLEHQVQALRMLPERVKAIRDGVESVRDVMHIDSQRATDLRADLRQLDQRIGRVAQRVEKMDEKLDAHVEEERVALSGLEQLGRGVDPDTNEPLPVAPAFKPDVWFWLKLMGACAVSGGVPIATAIIASS